MDQTSQLRKIYYVHIFIWFTNTILINDLNFKRLFYLNSMIEKSQIIDPSKFPHAKVGFGSTVKVVNIDTDEEEIYTLCGVLESEPENGLITVHSPLAKAMMGKGVNDEFKIKLPHANKEYEILEIKYINIFSLKKNIRTKKDFSFH